MRACRHAILSPARRSHYLLSAHRRRRSSSACYPPESSVRTRRRGVRILLARSWRTMSLYSACYLQTSPVHRLNGGNMNAAATLLSAAGEMFCLFRIPFLAPRRRRRRTLILPHHLLTLPHNAAKSFVRVLPTATHLTYYQPPYARLNIPAPTSIAARVPRRRHVAPTAFTIRGLTLPWFHGAVV